MRKSLLFLVVLGLLMPATAMAGDWWGVTTEWDYAVAPGNWQNNPVNMYQTERASFDPGDLTGTFMPIINASNNTEYGYARVRNGAVVYQTGGSHRWMNGTGTTSFGISLYSAAGGTLHMTGGTHTVDRASVGGYGMYLGPGVDPSPDGTGTINIWGTGEFRIRENPYVAGLADLWINTATSVIDIRDDGILEVPIALQGDVDAYIAGGQIVSGDGVGLQAEVVGDCYIVTVVPEPGTLLLLCLGLGTLALIRRK